jgi:hypothetical protein
LQTLSKTFGDLFSS